MTKTDLSSTVPSVVRFSREYDFQQEVSSLLSGVRGGPVTCHPIGESEGGRSIMAYVIGSGPLGVSLIAGSHSDEPVGPETLRTLVKDLILSPERFVWYLERFTFFIVPHVNPDGEARNEPWITRWPSIDAYLEHAFRELPGRDIEFGYPSMRAENEAVSGFLAEHAPFALHMSLHGMGFSDGALLLIERHWMNRVPRLKEEFRALSDANGWRLHDHDRAGEKGFRYLGPGFSTTPEGDAMRAHFLARGEPETAQQFHSSSMEFVRSLGGDPLCLVTELPLFLIQNRPDEEPVGRPETYFRLREALPQAKLAVENQRPTAPFLDDFGLSPIPLATAVRAQRAVIDLALGVVED